MLWTLGGLFGLMFVLSIWTHVATSSGFCTTCHSTKAASVSAGQSIHKDVPCLACHESPGMSGAVSYLPSLVREVAQQVGGIKTAGGVLKAASCSSCHKPGTGPFRIAGHPKPTSDCASCHGDVSHPGTEKPPTAPHPANYTQMHGADAAVPTPDPPGTPGPKCQTCHKQDFCSTCHFRTAYPHPTDWINQHGKVQEQQGASACTLCHSAPTFCKGCHGTEIPHKANWLGEHYVELRDASPAPCYVCHAQSDCTGCHSTHAVHNQQRIFGKAS